MSVQSAIDALRFLAEHDRPIGGEARFNSLHLHDLADDLQSLARITQSDLVTLHRLKREASVSKDTWEVCPDCNGEPNMPDSAHGKPWIDCRTCNGEGGWNVNKAKRALGEFVAQLAAKIEQ